MIIYKRAVIDEINRYLHTDDIIVIRGSRQVGKTSILMFLKDSLQYLSPAVISRYPVINNLACWVRNSLFLALKQGY